MNLSIGLNLSVFSGFSVDKPSTRFLLLRFRRDLGPLLLASGSNGSSERVLSELYKYEQPWKFSTGCPYSSSPGHDGLEKGPLMDGHTLGYTNHCCKYTLRMTHKNKKEALDSFAQKVFLKP